MSLLVSFLLLLTPVRALRCGWSGNGGRPYRACRTMIACVCPLCLSAHPEPPSPASKRRPGDIMAVLHLAPIHASLQLCSQESGRFFLAAVSARPLHGPVPFTHGEAE